ncbi:MAG: response regulator [Thermomicrobiales bacterium]
MMTPAGQQPGRILVVEDDLHIAEVLTDLLEDEGYQVATGVNGKALAAALDDPPGLILLDVMMPGMDGIEFCRRLKANEGTKDVPVVFVTAMPADLLTTQLAGASYEGIIRKPFTIDEVLDTVQRHLPQPSREA